MVNTLVPLIRNPSPSDMAMVFKSVTAEPASGSVIATAMSDSALRSFGKYRPFCAADAYSIKVRMAPKL